MRESVGCGSWISGETISLHSVVPLRDGNYRKALSSVLCGSAHICAGARIWCAVPGVTRGHPEQASPGRGSVKCPERSRVYERSRRFRPFHSIGTTEYDLPTTSAAKDAGRLHLTAGFPLRPAFRSGRLPTFPRAERCTQKAAPVDGPQSGWRALAQAEVFRELRNEHFRRVILNRGVGDPLLELAQIAPLSLTAAAQVGAYDGRGRRRLETTKSAKREDAEKQLRKRLSAKDAGVLPEDAIRLVDAQGSD